MVLRNLLPRLSEIKVGFNEVTVVHKDEDGYWVVRMPRALYAIRYVKWEEALEFAQSASAAAYAHPPKESAKFPQTSKIMINRESVSSDVPSDEYMNRDDPTIY